MRHTPEALDSILTLLKAPYLFDPNRIALATPPNPTSLNRFSSRSSSRSNRSKSDSSLRFFRAQSAPSPKPLPPAETPAHRASTALGAVPKGTEAHCQMQLTLGRHASLHSSSIGLTPRGARDPASRPGPVPALTCWWDGPEGRGQECRGQGCHRGAQHQAEAPAVGASPGLHLHPWMQSKTMIS
jgi:hypothetical protein